MKMNKKIFLIVIGTALIFFSLINMLSKEEVSINFAENTFEIFYSPPCECCENYAQYLRTNGFEVKLIKVEKITSIKEGFGIPNSMLSCHTGKIGKYFVEGHVPVKAIQKLLKEQPEIDGIALPDMPSGSPGMGGVKTRPFIIYAISGEKISEFIRI
jgi:hypothetical protein